MRPAAAAEAARFARDAGVVTIVDVEKVRPHIGELLMHIDAIIAAQEFPTDYTGYPSPGRALEALADEFRAPLVCVTLGREGSLARCGGREIRTPAFPVTCVDSTGAGDAFRGGFAAGCLRAPDGELEDALTLRQRGRGAELPAPRRARRRCRPPVKWSSCCTLAGTADA